MNTSGKTRDTFNKYKCSIDSLLNLVIRKKIAEILC